ncbi:MAG: hypothetical protein VW058_06600 [Flavobacteriaceae bacterium]
MANKQCNHCNDPVQLAFRVKHLPTHHAGKEWVFLCKSCTEEVSVNNLHYRYGGTWKG